VKYLPFVLAGLGLVLGMRGAYLAARSFQVYKFWSFASRALKLSATHLFSFNQGTVFPPGEATLAQKKAEYFDKAGLDAKYAFVGLAFLFAGFLLQVLAILVQILQGVP